MLTIYLVCQICGFCISSFYAFGHIRDMASRRQPISITKTNAQQVHLNHPEDDQDVERSTGLSLRNYQGSGILHNSKLSACY